MGIREVTNKEFRRFLSTHDSGSFKGYSLDQEKQPVVQVSWKQAAMFCNWLSEKEKLPPVYILQGNNLRPQSPLPTGYRLPTEAEWEYCARYAGNGRYLVYPWGDVFPPKVKSLNIADLSARNLLSAYLEKYDDGYPVTTTPGSFPANALGLFDLGGNVAEWCHDYYSIYPYLKIRNHSSYIDVFLICTKLRKQLSCANDEIIPDSFNWLYNSGCASRKRLTSPIDRTGLLHWGIRKCFVIH